MPEKPNLYDSLGPAATRRGIGLDLGRRTRLLRTAPMLKILRSETSFTPKRL